MYYTSLPDHSKPGFDEQSHFSQFKRQNIVFNALAGKSYRVRHVGCLSIKTILSGEEWYEINNRPLAVRPGQFLILNDNQDYTCQVDTAGEVRIQSVFFQAAFASAVFRDALTRESVLLDNPFEAEGPSLEFFQTLYDTDTGLMQRLGSLIASLNEYGYDSNRVDEHLVFLLHHLIRTHKKEAERARRVSAIKPATKKEIYKRLCIAKDFLHSTFMDKQNLSGISRTACLSSPQLVRQFKAVFRTTPHQYLTRIRLTHAAGLLKQTSTPVHEITWKCGFENTSAFCRAFKTEYGVPPLHFRMDSGE
ncbi:MAG TPA: AraC family transcriptional regulator [Puia sp.]|nr:AraC family transcriptional regulator [Puia sp.]